MESSKLLPQEGPSSILGNRNFFFHFSHTEYDDFFPWQSQLLFVMNLLKCHSVLGRIVTKLIKHQVFLGFDTHKCKSMTLSENVMKNPS
jgi:hypothetical protein